MLLVLQQMSTSSAWVSSSVQVTIVAMSLQAVLGMIQMFARAIEITLSPCVVVVSQDTALLLMVVGVLKTANVGKGKISPSILHCS
jgi:hypothetical protein